MFEAMRGADTDDTLMQALRTLFAGAVEAGYEAEDMAAVSHAFRTPQNTSPTACRRPGF